MKNQDSISHHRRWVAAFTLLELLIVMTIISILAGIAFPVITSTLKQAEMTHAKKDCTDVATAISNFFYDTHRYPVPQAGQIGEDSQMRSDAELIAHLQGENDTWNREKVPYYNGAEGKGGRGGLVRDGDGWKLVDPWAMMYYIDLDTNRDRYVHNPYEGDVKLFIPALVYSHGPDGKFSTTSDNVQSWR